MITNLISSIEFGKSIGYIDNSHEYRQLRNRYDALIQQKPTLSMFIACVDGVAVSEPKHYDLYAKYGSFTQYGDDLVAECKPYQQAQDNVLFAGFECVVKPDVGFVYLFNERVKLAYDSLVGCFLLQSGQITTLEDLTSYNLPLTPKAQQIIYGTK